MAELYNYSSSLALTTLVESCELEQEVNQIVNYSRSGQVYIQILGNPRKSYLVVCHAKRAEVANIENALAAGHTIRVTMSHGTYYGIIVEFEKNPVVDPNNLTFDGSSNEEYFKVELKLAYISDPTSSNSSSGNSGSGSSSEGSGSGSGGSGNSGDNIVTTPDPSTFDP